jgi:type I restriction enzyme S subunit
MQRKGSIPYYGANGPVGFIDEHLFDEDLVLVVEDETFVGRQKPFSYIVRGKSWVNNHAHVLRPFGGVSVEYLNICLQFHNFTPLTSGSTGRRKLTQEALLTAPLAIAPYLEQVEIVRRVEKLFTLADRLETRVVTARKRVEALTQSILAKAFRGELVPTEAELAEAEGREYETASMLLERIKSAANHRSGSDGAESTIRKVRSVRASPSASKGKL